MALRPNFDPASHDLDPKFRLTKFTGMFVFKVKFSKVKITML